ncbi:hypothetical protein XENOCAPTIV_017505 [Xenoophorus captivus]|uniref:Ig-like domain-containing protein n=1 Tax=Xenoophorus captivus TaxID=1517983 RepID=A0ABV0RCL9_9TELE
MTGGRELLLLAVMPLLVRCQKPSVSMSPRLESIFTGDLFYLYCKDVSSGDTATWYFNNKALENKNSILKIAPAASKNSGTYQCKINDRKSDDFHVRVLGKVQRKTLSSNPIKMQRNVRCSLL